MPVPQQNLDALNNPDFHRQFSTMNPDDQKTLLSKMIPGYSAMPPDRQQSMLSDINLHGNTLTQPKPANPILQSNGPDYRDPYNSLNDAANFASAAWKDTASAYQGFKDYVKEPFKDELFNPAKRLGGAIPKAAGAVMGEYLNPDTKGVEKAAGVASALLGGDPAQARDERDQGNYGAAMWDEFGRPAATMAAAEGAAEGLSMLGRPAARKEIENLSNIIAPGVKEAYVQDAARDILPLYKEAAKRAGLKNENFFQQKWFGDTPTRQNVFDRSDLGKPLEGSRKAIEVANHAVDISMEPLEEVLKTTGNLPIDPKVRNGIVKELEANKALYAGANKDTNAIGAIDGQIADVKKAKTYGDLNDLKVKANKAIENMMGGRNTPSGMQAATIEPLYTYKQYGAAIRNNMYPELQSLTKANFDLGKIGKLEAQAMDARDGIYTNAAMMSRGQASETANKYIENVLGGSLYKSHVARRLLGYNPTPAGQFNRQFRRGIGDIPEGMTPSSTTSTVVPGQVTPSYTTFPQQPLQLPAQAGPSNLGGQPAPPVNNPFYIGSQQPQPSPFTFNLPTSTGGPEVNPTQIAYKGASIQPQLTQGPKAKARFKAPEAVQGTADRPVESPPGYLTPSRTQHLTSTAEPVKETIPGNLAQWHSGSAEQAESTLKNLKEFSKGKEFKNASKDQQYRINQQIKQLQQQLKQWKIGQAMKGPPSGAVYHPATQGPPDITVTHTPAKIPKGKSKAGIGSRVAPYGTRTLLPPPPNQEEEEEDNEQ
jgi:hypothetical protein